MTKYEFRDRAGGFAHWMADRLSHAQGGFNHLWASRSRKTGFAIGYVWECNSIFNAYQNYRWPSVINGRSIRDFEETADALSDFQALLIAGTDAHDGDQCRAQIDAILEWGGVDRYPRIAAGIRALDNSALPGYLAAVREYFSHPLDTDDEFNYDGPPLVLDSGTTKIFSLICENFVIYDSRVGAALGLLVRHWSQSVDTDGIPDELRFAWGDNGTEPVPEKRRNPNLPAPQNNIFPFIRYRTVNRTHQNIFANWLLEHVLQLDAEKPHDARSGFADLDPAIRLRALEAALFMIGYCVNDMYTADLVASGAA